MCTKQAKLKQELASAQAGYEALKAQELKLNMARGKPGADQLALSMPMLDVLNSGSDCKDEGIDCRNYGELTGIPSAKKLFGEVMGVSADEIIIGGSSSPCSRESSAPRSLGVNTTRSNFFARCPATTGISPSASFSASR